MINRRWLILLSLLILAACDNTEDAFMVGTLERDRVELSAESNEPIIALHVEDGQAVNAGDLILSQDPSRLEAVLAQQLALRAQAAARLAELQRGPRPEAIREARAQLQSSQALSQNAVANLKRVQELYARDLSDQATLDGAQTLRKTTSAAEAAATESLEALLNGTTVEELQQAQAVVDAATARVDQVQLDLERLNIRAPVSGLLDRQLFELGERPRPGDAVAIILDDSRSYARIYVPEYVRAEVQPGKQLEVAIDGVEHLFRGTVRWVSADASFTPYFALTEHDRSRLSYLAEVDIPDAGTLPAGLPLEVHFPAGFQADD